MAKPLAVLIVEDSESDAQLLIRLLHKAGFKVGYEVVETAEGMRAALGKQAWDIVISDYSLPQFSGSAALTLLKETGGDIPFIVVSGTMGEETAVAMMKSGAHDYLVKGNLARLVPAIERELEQAVVRREGRQAQEKMQASEKRFRALIENSSDAITLLDAKGKVIYDSPSAPGMLGYGPVDWIGRDAFDLMHPDDLRKNRDLFRELQKTPGKSAHTTFRVMHSSGSWSWIEATATNLLEEPTVNAIVLNYRDITRRMEAEEVLRASEERFRLIFDTSLDGILLIAPDGSILAANSSACRMFDRSEEEIKQVQRSELVDPSDLRLDVALEERSQKGRFFGELTLIHKDGTKFPGEVSTALFKDKDGRLRTSMILRDISGRKLREEQLVESESRYKSLFDNSGSSIHIVDRDGKYLQVNKKSAENFGRAVKDVEGKSIFDFMPRPTAQKYLEAYRSLIESGGHREHEDTFELSGVQKTFLIIDQCLQDARGHNIAVQSSAVDISERKKSEEALRESNSIFLSFLEQSEDAIMLADEQGSVIQWSKGAEKLTGYSRDESLGKLLWDVQFRSAPDEFKSPENYELIKTSLQKVLLTGQGTELSHLIEATIQRPDGTRAAAQTSAFSIHTDKGYFLGSILRDITERKQTEVALRESEARYRELFEDSPISLWEEDYSAVKQKLDDLRANGITNFRDYFRLHPEVVTECADLIKILDVNKATLRLFGADHKEEMLNSLAQIFGGEAPQAFQDELITIAEGKTKLNWEGINKTLDGRLIDIDMSWSIAPGYEESLSKVFISLIDITERKQAEEALARSEREYRTLFENIPIGLYRTSADGRILDANDAMVNMFGYPDRESLLAENVVELYLDPDADRRFKSKIEKTGVVTNFEAEFKRPDGTTFWTEDHNRIIRDEDGTPLFYEGSLIDITERKRAEEELLAERDLLTTLIDTLPDNIFIKDVMGRILMNNTSHRRTLGANTLEQVVGKTDFDFFPAELASQYDADDKQLVRSGQPLIDKIEPVLDKENNQRWLQTTKVPLRDRQGNITGIVGFNHDITERKRAEELLAGERNLLRTLVDNLPDRITAKDIQGRKTLSNLADWKASGGKKMEDVIGMTDFDTYPPELAEGYWSIDKTVLDTGMPSINHEERGLDADGNPVWVLSTKIPLRDGHGNVTGLVGIGRDITERKHADEMLMAERDLLTTLINTLPDSIFIKDVMGRIVMDNDAHRRTLGANTLEQVVGKTDFDFHPREQAAQYDADEKQVIRSGEPLIDKMEPWIDKVHDQKRWLLTTKVPLRDRQGNFTGIVGFNHDITERKQADERLQHQLEHLAALRAIDQVIISSFDLRNSLTEILKHVTKELRVDAADVLTLSSGYQSLEFSAGIGFRTRAAEKASVRLGQSHAGRVALERHLIQVPNLKDQPEDIVLKTVLAGEDFVCYYGVPLIAKGSVKGVLEIYHRSPLEPDGEWLEFLNTLADQAALAIDNSHLFENLQRSNIDLTLAYDATIEGWSRAMDLRDKETEGHTQRVTEMTMELATLFGIQDEDLVGVRRGALLHDIGKMGVPDAILLKPSTLTDEEWVIMRRHPALAFEMLSPIHYLQSAIDIPYCHHEKWDGTGYPRGLKGEQIPLSARIFALADVWDALTSDRPYRNAWPNEKVLEYLKSEAGKHFDPEVVRICLDAGVFSRKRHN